MEVRHEAIGALASLSTEHNGERRGDPGQAQTWEAQDQAHTFCVTYLLNVVVGCFRDG